MFFPLRDDNPRHATPVVVIGVIAACALVFLYQALGDPASALVMAAGCIPAEVASLTDLVGAEVRVDAIGRPVGRLDHVEALVPLPGTVVTSMFLHGGLAHLLGNMWYLWIFGDNLEDVMGRGRFVVFYLLCGVAAALTQVAVDTTSTTPMIGASGAVAGVLGGYMLLWPHARVLTFIVLFVFIRTFYLPAFILLGLWFLMQFLNILGGGSGVAWYAHIGGFVAGMVLVRLFVRNPPRRVRSAAWS